MVLSSPTAPGTAGQRAGAGPNRTALFINQAEIPEILPAKRMQVSAAHLELIFVASTVSAAWGVGWVATTVPAPRVGQLSVPVLPVPVRLTVVPV